MDLTLGHGFLLALLAIIWINIVLSGDNAVAIALACRPLSPKQRRWGISLGSLAAIVLRIVCATFVVYLLRIPYLKITGGLLLFWIAVKLILPEEISGEGEAAGSTTLFAAVRTVVIADAVMSLDNVIAIAAAAHDSLLLLVLGLVISMPLIVCGSTLVLKALERFPQLVTVAGGLLGWIAGDVVVTDPALIDWLDSEARFLHTAAPIAGAAVVGGGGVTLSRMIEARRRRKLGSRVLIIGTSGRPDPFPRAARLTCACCRLRLSFDIKQPDVRGPKAGPRERDRRLATPSNHSRVARPRRKRGNLRSSRGKSGAVSWRSP